jgi:hypothetical protein
MKDTTHEVDQRTNNILYLPQIDMITQFGSIWVFGIFSTCLPVLKCVEESSTTMEPELQENLIRSSEDVKLAPPHSPLMLVTDDSASMPPKEMQAFSNKTNVENDKDHSPDLEGLLNEMKLAKSQVLCKHLCVDQIQFLHSCAS